MARNRTAFIVTVCIVFVTLMVCVLNSVQVYKLSRQTFQTAEILASSKNQEAEVAIKYAKAQARKKPYDIGIFGNSRSYMMAESDFDLSGGKSFFNFSNGGSSFVQSVKFIELLADENLAPKTILVSLDHPQIQYTGYVKYPNPIFHPGAVFMDFINMVLSYEGTLRRRLSDAVKVLDWAKDHTWKSFTDAWKSDILIHRVSYVWMRLTHQKMVLPEPHNDFRNDGSIVEVLPATRIDYTNQTFGSEGLRGWDRHVYLGIKRLDAVAKKTSSRIVVYESPIWPEHEASDIHIRRDAIDTHRWFVAGCRNTQIECVNAWKLQSAESENWSDCCHAPARDLGLFFRYNILNQ